MFKNVLQVERRGFVVLEQLYVPRLLLPVQCNHVGTETFLLLFYHHRSGKNNYGGTLNR